MPLTPPFDGNDALRLLDSIPAATLFGRPDGSINFANAAARAMFGYSADEMVGLHRRDLLDDNAPQVQAALAERAATGVVDFDVECRRKDGTHFTAQISSSLFAGPRDETWVAVSLRDVSAARDREEHLIADIEQLAFALKRFPAILPGLPDRTAGPGPDAADTARQVEAALLLDRSPEATIFSRPDGRIVTANAAACTLLGYRKDELPGLQRRDLVDIDDPRLKASLAARERSGFTEGELEFRRKDGSRFLGQFRATAFKAPDGTDWVCTSLRDATEIEQATRALRDSEGRYARVLEGSDQGFWDWDLVSGQFTVSDRFETMLGFAPGERDLSPGMWPNYVHPDDMPVALASIERHLAGASAAHEVEIRCLTRAGDWRWILTCGRVVERSADGRPTIMSGTHTDIHQRKATETALRRSEARFRAMIEIAPVPCALNDDEHRILFLNDAFVCTFGYTLDDIPTLEDWWQRAYPDPAYRRWVKDEWRARLARTRAEGSVFPPIEIAIQCKDGTLRTVMSSATAIGADFGSTHLAILYDISSLKRNEAALRASHDHLRLVTAHSADVISLHDAAGRYLFVSDASRKLIGYSDVELRGRDPCELIHPDDHPLVREALRRATTDPEIGVTAYRLRDRDGDYRWVESTARAVHDDQGALVEIVISTRDIGEHVRVENTLRQLAATDFLTGLPNRREFAARLGEEMARVQRGPQSAALLMLDLDHFKAVNDRYGHAVGDLVLRHFADLLRGQLRKLDSAGRVGGEEFAIVLTGADLPAALAFAERVRQRTAAAVLVVGDHRISMTVSIGVTAIRPDDPGADAVMARADEALYAAKHGGRNRVTLGQPL